MTRAPSLSRQASALAKTLNDLGEWISSKVLPAGSGPNRYMASWKFTPEGCEEVLNGIGKPRTAHETLAHTTQSQARARMLHERMKDLGAFTAGTGVWGIEAFLNSQHKTLFRASVSGLSLNSENGFQVAPATKAQTMVGMLEQRIALLARVPTARGRCARYCVNNDFIDAPDARTAAAIHLVAHNPRRLTRILDEGPEKGHYKLDILRLETNRGEDLFSSLHAEIQGKTQ